MHIRAAVIYVLNAAVTIGLPWAAGCSTNASGKPAYQDETDRELCTRLSRDCDLLTATDVCGTMRTVNCGSCTAPLSCGGGGTMNLCGSPSTDTDGGPASRNADAETGDSEGGSDADSTGAGDASIGPDGCSFVCPTRPHWVTGTFTITYANAPLTGTVVPVDGKFQPLLNETISFVASFDEGAMVKSMAQKNEYDVDVVISQENIAYQGDTTGVLDKYLKPAIAAASTGNARFAYSANERMTVGLGSGVEISFTCANLTLPVGPDQYIVPGDVACAMGNVGIMEIIQNTVANTASGTGSFAYH